MPFVDGYPDRAITKLQEKDRHFYKKYTLERRLELFLKASRSPACP